LTSIEGGAIGCHKGLTDEIKAKVFGLNAARIWNLKSTASAAPAAGRRSGAGGCDADLRI
jgi:hypothetical protein